MRTSIPLFALALFASCTGPTGVPGTNGTNGVDGVAWFTERGLAIEVTGLEVSASGATVDFTLTDDADGDPATPGTPLDPDGELTAGAVSVRFVLAQLADAAAEPYAPYTTKSVGGQPQAAAESGGTFQPVDVRAGRYRYTFAASTAAFDASRTQTVLAVALRTLDGIPYRARALRSVRPAGGAPAVRAVVDPARCNDCHGRLTAHDEGYDAVAQCLLCHAPGTADPDTMNSLDLRVMVHKIHRGEALPSVAGGTPYRLVGAGGVAHDYSTVRHPQSIERCDGCHGGAAQGQAWRTAPSIAACTSCHDTTSFAETPPPGTVAHTDGPQADGSCTACHPDVGGTSPCSGAPCSVTAAHVDPSFDPGAPVIALTILEATVAGPGTAVQLQFAIAVDGAPRNVLVNPLNPAGVIRATIAGPNGGYDTLMTVGTSTNPYAQATIQGSGASGTLEAVDAAQGVFRYTFPGALPVPPSASGSWTVGLEAYFSGPAGERYVAVSPTRAFAVTDAAAVPRRTVVDPARCDACHFALQAHNTRRGAAICLLCHGPANANDERAPRLEGTSAVLAESVDLRVMIHRIHMGERLTQPYRLATFPAPSPANPGGTLVDFATTRMPRSPAECAACHADPAPGGRPSWTLPIAEREPSILQELTCTEPAGNDTDSYCTSPFWSVTQTLRVPPEAAACTGCHDQPFVAVHAELAATPTGEESCATCHGPGALYDAERFHRP